MKKYSPIVLTLALVLPSILFAQMPETAPLEAGDLDRFIETYTPLTTELEALGEDFEEVKDYNAIQALAANEKVMAVFEKYGWDDAWMGKWMTISVAYGLVKMEEELAKLPADQRAQYEEYMSASMAPLKEMVSDEDVKAVKERTEELDVLFDYN